MITGISRKGISMLDRPPEFWVGVGAAALYVFRKSETKHFGLRITEAGVSGGLGFSLAPSAAQWAGGSETIAAVLITALGYLGLDVLTSIVADRAVIREIIMRRLGGGNGGGK